MNNISCGSSSSKIAAENQWFNNSGSESSLQPPPHQSHVSGLSSMLASSNIHSEPGSNASKYRMMLHQQQCRQMRHTESVEYCDLWDTGPAAVALRLLRAEEQRNKSPTPAHATPAAGRASSADAFARQRHIYETALDLPVQQRVPDLGLGQMAQSHGCSSSCVQTPSTRCRHRPHLRSNISCGSSSSKIAAENQWFNNSGSESSLQPPPHQSHVSGLSSMLASSNIHSEPGSNASKYRMMLHQQQCRQLRHTESVEYCDLWDTGPAAVALRLLRAEEQRNKSPTPAHATPAAGRASSADAFARQRHIYETALDLPVQQRVPDLGLGQMAQSHGCSSSCVQTPSTRCRHRPHLRSVSYARSQNRHHKTAFTAGCL
ncbi:hypothetical protein HPB49_000633 [Dermacentor silvarum]|uniref:Uncharacterized protein n=1 Tax=Dermacentor silvarum TaxID=543639 RepID=A0ACB8DHT7_DERSI|nr:hypothetical protein HPB49_000633 [Dermacentor silvarum]